MRRLLAPGIVLALALVLVPSDLRAQEPSGQAVDAARAAEMRGLRHEASGRMAEAASAYAEALEEVASRLGETSGDERALLAARSEVYVHRLDFFHSKMADVASAVERFEGIAIDGRLPWTTRDLARSFLGSYRLSAGDLAGAGREAGRLGYVRDWLVCGPFDNERGGGFGLPYPPEREVDLDATYQGKRREVTWRAPAVRPSRGVLDLDDLLRPNDQALAYAVTWVHADEGRPAAVRVGSDDAVEVFVNGDSVIERDVQRTLRFDQDVAGVVLDEGWNRILVKAAERTGAWRVALRLTAPDGAPLEGVRVASAEEMRTGLDSSDGTARVPADPGGIDDLTERAATTDDPWILYHLGYLRIRRRAHDETEHPDRRALERAVELAPDRPAFRFLLALVSGQEGEAAVQRDLNPRRQQLEAVVRLDPDHLRAHVALGQYYLGEVRIPGKALRHARVATEANPSFVDARVLEIRALRRRDLDLLANDAVRRAAAGEVGDHPSILLLEARRLAGTGDAAGALAVAREALNRDAADGEAAELVDRLLRRVGDLDALVAHRRAAVSMAPTDAGARRNLARAHRARSELGEAEEVLLRAIEVVPDDTDLREGLGRVRHLAGDLEGAIEAFENALRIDPNLAELERYVQFIRADREPFEREFRIDPAEAIARAEDVPVDPEVSYRVLLDNVAHRIFEDGTHSEYAELVCRIENQEGVEQFDVHRIPFAVGEQRVRILRAEVIRSDGTTESARIRNRGPGQAGEFTTYRYTGVDLPPLEPGDVVAIEYRKDDLERGFFGDYYGETVSFRRTVPVTRARFSLVRPLGRELHFRDRGLGVEPTRESDPEEGVERITWEASDLERIDPEPRMPPMREVVEGLEISTWADWESFGRWYWNLVRRQYQVTDEMRETVEELTADASTDMERIRAIYDFVVTDIRYNDRWEFGVHGFKPYSAASIFSRRFGDCKDKATLLNVMLGEVGITSYPVLIHAARQRPEQDLDLPLISHFNHCISYVPEQEGVPDGGMFLDGTAQYHPADVLPAMDHGARVVVITPEGGEVREVPWPDPSENRIEERHELEVEETGEDEVEGTLDATWRPRGSFDPAIRGWLENEGDRERLIEQLYGSELSGATVREVEVSDLDDLSEPIEVRTVVEVPSPTRSASGDGQELRQIGSIIFRRMRVGSLSDLATLSERDHDLLLPGPSSVREETTYELPAGWSTDAVPEGEEISSEFGVFRTSYEVEDGSVRVVRELELRTPRVEPSEYEAFRSFANDVDEADARQIIIRSSADEE